MRLETVSSIVAVVVAALSGVATARAARRTPRQESRDDFLAVSEQQGRQIARLEARAERQEAEVERQRQRIAAQDATIGYLHAWVRQLVGHIRGSGQEPPRAPKPVPEAVRAFLPDIDA